ncbi:MAG: class I SAM-dependent methyltransferase [Caulobacter sp.]|nr:class I SAM-dependent methyltransferase [Caulobacter sp.]
MLKVQERDTDADWREIGATEPFWGVLTDPRFKSENLTAANVESFYGSGVDHMAEIVDRLRRQTGAPPRGRALDFGCGAGRLSEAMTAHADHVVGYDISPGMLEKARLRHGAAHYTDVLPDGPFDWINSFIVFQHIPPERGAPLMEALLDRLAPGGHVSLHVTVWRDAHLEPSRPPLLLRLRRAIAQARGRIKAASGLIMMYDYDLSSLVRSFQRHGVEEINMVATNHGGHHGVIILGRRKPEGAT